MSSSSDKIDVALEIGKKRVFASAIEWPGWARGGRDEASALQALCDYGPRYANILQTAGFDFKAPADPSDFTVVERLQGDVSTDFGAPGKAPSSDARPLDDAELRYLQTLLQACWGEFDRAVSAATGKELRKGPRGGGRDLEKIVRHVLDADAAYLRRIAWKLEKREESTQDYELERTRQAILEALVPAARGDIPAQGPRGGKRWTARYFVRRSAWHVLDHAWEIEDRIID